MTCVLAVAPAVCAITGSIFAVVRNVRNNRAVSKAIIDKFEEVRLEIFNTKEYSELKDKLSIVYQENIELKKQINKMLTKMDKISRGN